MIDSLEGIVFDLILSSKVPEANFSTLPKMNRAKKVSPKFCQSFEMNICRESSNGKNVLIANVQSYFFTLAYGNILQHIFFARVEKMDSVPCS